MGEQDRLAELLERATRERRGDDHNRSEDDLPSRPRAGPPGEVLLEGWLEEDDDRQWSAEPSDTADSSEQVTGGEWLPPDPGRHRTDGARPPVLTVPRSLRSVTLGVRPLAVLGLLVVALAAAGIFGLRWWQAERGSTPQPLAPLAAQAPASPRQGDAAAATAGSAGTTGASEEGMPTGQAVGEVAGAPTASELLVHVAGEVRSPGVVRLEPGARVHDALAAAGGLAPDADTSRLNLARTVADGERIWVPRPGEDVPEVIDSSGAAPGDPAGGGSALAPGAGADQQINLNTADQALLEELPGVGPVTAAAIIQWRTEHGRFSTPDELLEVSGIGEATLEKLRPHVTL